METTHLLDTMLSAYLADRTPLTIVLRNRSRVSGRIRAFDSYVIVLDNPGGEILYRHAISSIAPTPAAVPARQPAERSPQKKQTAPPVRPSAPHAARRKQERPEPKTAAATEPSLNTSMKEGLLRWMQENRTK
jgi:RNA chaperone Hfq